MFFEQSLNALRTILNVNAKRNIFQLIYSSTFISVAIVYADEGAGEGENLTKSDEDGVVDFS